MCEKLFGKQQIGFSLGWLGGKEIWDGELSLACLSAVSAWALRVPLARGSPALEICM